MADSVRFLDELKSECFDDENHPTPTSEEQIDTERIVLRRYDLTDSVSDYDPEAPRLQRAKHRAFLRKSLNQLSGSYQCLDCSRPWLCYWILHSMQLLDQAFPIELINNVSSFLNQCQDCEGGFGGGPGQFSHLAPTYAAVCALCILSHDTAYKVINREKLVSFLWSLKQPNGAFAVHVGGEVDIRGVYCAVSVARLTNCYSDELFENSAEWIATCQTYEGGFAGYPGMEAHGGYTFCGLAALVLLQRPHLCDLTALLRWSANRQMRLEGGFSGRANKLVDGCYSFWLGGVFPILQSLLTNEGSLPNEDHWLFNQNALQDYILTCCQHQNGGCLDKPKKERDLYHTCYVLSGLSVAQNSKTPIVIGSMDSKVQSTHPLFNVSQEASMKAAEYFLRFPVPTLQI